MVRAQSRNKGCCKEKQCSSAYTLVKKGKVDVSRMLVEREYRFQTKRKKETACRIFGDSALIGKYL